MNIQHSPIITRRAFPLDSRAVWVEQVLVNDSLVPRDNLPLGPGEYNAQIQDRHISTPSLGKSNSISHFLPFKSNLSIRTPQNSTCNVQSSSSVSLLSSVNSAATDNTRSDFATIFHEHDIRQPLDPNRRFCATPGSYLGPESMLRHVNTDGIQVSKRIHFGPNTVPFGERNKYKKAGGTYDVQYDSLHVRPKPKFGPFLKSARVLKLGIECSDDKQSSPPAPRSSSPTDAFSIASEEYSIRPFTNSYRASLVPLPKIKTKAPPRLHFDDSSYTNSRKGAHHDLTPSYIKKEARIELFSSIATIPRKHVSTAYPTKIKKQIAREIT